MLGVDACPHVLLQLVAQLKIRVDRIKGLERRRVGSGVGDGPAETQDDGALRCAGHVCTVSSAQQVRFARRPHQFLLTGPSLVRSFSSFWVLATRMLWIYGGSIVEG